MMSTRKRKRTAVDPGVRLAKRITRKYGRKGMQTLLQILVDEKEPGKKLAFAFQVSRQTINKWRHTLGAYQIHPAVAEYARLDTLRKRKESQHDEL